MLFFFFQFLTFYKTSGKGRQNIFLKFPTAAQCPDESFVSTAPLSIGVCHLQLILYIEITLNPHTEYWS